MHIVTSAVLIADTEKQEKPLRRIVLIYPACFEYGVKVQCKNHVELLKNERYDPFWFGSTIFNIDTFCSDIDEITLFKIRIKQLFENRIEGRFIDILRFKNSPVIEAIEKPLLDYDFPNFLLQVNNKLGPLV